MRALHVVAAVSFLLATVNSARVPRQAGLCGVGKNPKPVTSCDGCPNSDCHRTDGGIFCCKPNDVSVCRNLTMITTEMANVKCGRIFAMVLDPVSTPAEKCRSLKESLTCVAKRLLPGNHQECMDAMNDYILTHAMELQVFMNSQTTFQVSFDPNNCTSIKDDTSICKSLERVKNAVEDSPSCMFAFAPLLIPGTTEEISCSAFNDGLKCVAQILLPADKDGCLEAMIEYVKGHVKDLQVLLQELVPGSEVTFDPRECSGSADTCRDLSAITLELINEGGDCLTRAQISFNSSNILEEKCSALLGALRCVASQLPSSNAELCLEQIIKLFKQKNHVVMALLKRVQLPIDPTVCFDIFEDKDLTCLDVQNLLAAAVPCKQQFARVGAAANAQDKCSAFKAGVECIAGHAAPSRVDSSECLSNIFKLLRNVESYRQALQGLASQYKLPSLASFNFQFCAAPVCGLFEPAPGETCSEGCSQSHVCKQGKCCPEAKEGVCPKPTASDRCSSTDRTCSADNDCGNDEKCCRNQCGLVCMRKAEEEDEEKGKCRAELRKALTQVSICNDKLVHIPRCNKGEYAPRQDFEPYSFCVYKNGTEITGSQSTQGNLDCTSVHEGYCPALSGTCTKPVETCKSDDNCGKPQKCCKSIQSGQCIVKCVDPRTEIDSSELPSFECPNGVQPSCCKLTLCLVSRCASNPAAKCQVDRCGGCTPRFYDADQNEVDCNEGLSKCQIKQSEAYSKVMDQMSEEEKLRLLYQRNKGPDEEGERYNDNDGNNTIDDLESAFRRLLNQSNLCPYLDQLNVCKNGGKCKIDMDKAQICDCTGTDHYGLFCAGQQRNPDTNCTRLRSRSREMIGTLGLVSRNDELIQLVFTIFPPKNNMRPDIQCDSQGQWSVKQCAWQYQSEEYFCFCTDTSSTPGEMLDKSPRATSIKLLDCTQGPSDFYDLPFRCLMEKGVGNCDLSSAVVPPMWYFDTTSKTCLPLGYTGCAGNKNRFMSPTGCYSVCRGELVKPPCANCDYTTSFCAVPATSTTNSVTTVTPNECKAYPAHCQLPMETGTGNMTTKAFYFNVDKRQCDVFHYNGKNGNRNRFSTMHQCKIECLPREDMPVRVVCPDPKNLDPSMPQVRNGPSCTSDTDCANGHITLHCCSNGRTSVCLPPITDSCVNGERCPYYSTCTGNQGTSCECPEECPPNIKMVCGTDGITYRNECLMKFESCRTNKYIAKAHDDSCDDSCPGICTEQYEPVCGSDGKTYGNACVLRSQTCQTPPFVWKVSDGKCSGDGGDRQCMCTKEYSPVCAQVRNTTTGQLNIITYGNRCQATHAKTCDPNVSSVDILYGGVCESECNCPQSYEICVRGRCTCDVMCPNYDPVCGHQTRHTDKNMTFDNECAMRVHACKNKKLFVTSHEGKCTSDENMKGKCPDQTNAQSTEKLCSEGSCGANTTCCPYGDGTKCIKDSRLIKQVVVKPGVCPIISNFTYIDADDGTSRCDMDMCTDDGGCGGTAKCCENMACSHKTCSIPTPNFDDTLCHTGQYLVRNGCSQDVLGSCPLKSRCIGAFLPSRLQVFVCCALSADKPDIDSEAIKRSELCTDLAMFGIKCQNGGTCVGDVRKGNLCKCPAGYYGDLCQKSLPPANCSVSYNCLVSPCDNASCPAVTSAKCSENYCGGCNALFKLNGVDVTEKCRSTSCLKLKAVTNLISNKLGIGAAAEDKQSESNGEGDTVGGDGTREGKPFLEHLRKSLLKSGISKLPVSVQCDKRGQFQDQLCVLDLVSNRMLCHCIKPDGSVIADGPVASHPDRLNCSIINSDLPQACLKPPATGLCKAFIKMYFYNVTSRTCEKFTYGGCQGNANRFPTYAACKHFCSGGGPEEGADRLCKTIRCEANKVCNLDENGRPVCVDPRKPISSDSPFVPKCSADGKFTPKQCHMENCFCVDPDTGEFKGGSMAAGNNTECTETEETCATDLYKCTADPCKVNKCPNVPGATCRANYCGGCNANFYSEGHMVNDRCNAGTTTSLTEECDESQPAVQCPKDFCVQAKCVLHPNATCKIYSCGGCKARFYVEGKEVTHECDKGCFKEPQPGPCEARLPRWFYNQTSSMCEKFFYGGCDGNGNNFKEAAQCSKHCGDAKICMYGERLENAFCGRGPNRMDCPSGYSCRIHPADAFAICCRDDPFTGDTTTKPKKTCPGSTVSPRPCYDGGDPCNDCKKSSNARTDSSTGTCQCQSCPNGQSKRLCPNLCNDRNCTNPLANCRIDPCTCRAQFVDLEGKPTKCDSLQSNCAIKRNAGIQEVRRKALGNSQASDQPDSSTAATNVIPECSDRSYATVQCTLDNTTCWCADPNTGALVASTKTTSSGNRNARSTINCADKTRKKAIAAKIKVKISDILLVADITKRDGDKIIRLFCVFVQGKGAICLPGTTKVTSGSIYVEAVIEPNATSAISKYLDIQSLVDVLTTAGIKGEFKVDLEDGTVLTSTTATSELLTSEEPPIVIEPPKKDNKTAIIVGVVVGVVCLAIIIAVACFCLKKKKKQKDMDVKFSDIKGHENPTYK